MNNGKLCAFVVLLCVVCPLIVGYAWPVSEGTTYNHVVGAGQNVTSDLQNGNVEIFADYTDLFNNNNYVYGINYWVNVDNSLGFNNKPIRSTTSVTAVPDPSTGTYTQTTATTDGDGFYEMDPRTFVNTWCPNANVVAWWISAFDEIDLTDGIVAAWVMYYPDSDMMFALTGRDSYDDFGPIEQVPVDTITFSGNPNQLYAIVYYYNEYSRYADLDYGFEIPKTWDQNMWVNGYENRSVDVLLKLEADSYVPFQFNIDTLPPADKTRMEINVDSSGQISMTVRHQSDNSSETQTLGNISVYPYILFNVDYNTEKITLSGLRGMENFQDDYRDKIKAQIEFVWKDAKPFYCFELGDDNANGAWYVARTSSNIATVAGTGMFSSFDFADYTGGNGQLQIRAVQIWPVSTVAFHIDINGGSNTVGGYTYWGETHKDGTLDFPTDATKNISGTIYPIAVDPVNYHLNNLLIALIDDDIYFNGAMVVDPETTINHCELVFRGGYVASFYFYPITEVPQASYDWIVGGFGLDVSGFCAVGLMTSFGSGLAASMYGKRSGVKTGLVLLTALMCGVVYLVILMDGL